MARQKGAKQQACACRAAAQKGTTGVGGFLRSLYAQCIFLFFFLILPLFFFHGAGAKIYDAWHADAMRGAVMRAQPSHARCGARQELPQRARNALFYVVLSPLKAQCVPAARAADSDACKPIMMMRGACFTRV